MNFLIFTFISCTTALISPIPRSKSYESCVRSFSKSWPTAEQKDFACTAAEIWQHAASAGQSTSLQPEEKEWFTKLENFNLLDPGLRKPCLRKEYRVLTDKERNKFHGAINKLKTTRLSSGITQYDLFVKLHTASFAPGAHGGASFLPWHREFLKRFEIALRLMDPEVCLPYWDNTLDKVLDNPSESIIWSPEFMGNGNGFVTSGPFAQWKTPITGGTLDRNVESSPSNLMNNGVINRLLVHQTLANISCQTNCEFEAAHSAVHLFVGGKMSSLVSAPEDPLFYLHHAFVDCIWDLFRQRQLHNVHPVNDYPTSNFGSSYHHPVADMLPFTGYRNIDGTADYSRFYKCSPRPTCSGPNSVQRSRYVLCEQTNRGMIAKSALKSQKPATCDPMETEQPQNSFCINGKCDTNLWSFIPVSVIHVKSEPGRDLSPAYPVHNNQPNYNIDVYSGMRFDVAKNASCSVDGSCCQKNRGVHLHAVGLNFQGSYKERVIVDPRPMIASADACVGVPNPEKYGIVKVRLRASDNCGNVCEPYCLVVDPDGAQQVSYKRCSGDIVVNSKSPQMYRNSLKEVEEARWGHVDPPFDHLPFPKRSHDFVIFYCNQASDTFFNTDMEIPAFKPNFPDFDSFEPTIFHPDFPSNKQHPHISVPRPPNVSPEPPHVRPEPPIVRPEPPHVKPEPPIVRPEPPVVRPEPPHVKPEPPIVRSEPPIVEPEPPIIEPEPPIVRTEPPIVRPEPPIVRPEPPIVRPEPPIVRPEPPIVRPEPPHVKPEPPINPTEPPIVTAEPWIVRPEPPNVLPDSFIADPFKHILKPNQIYQIPMWPKPKPYQYSKPKPKPYKTSNHVTHKPSVYNIRGYYPMSRSKSKNKYYPSNSFPFQSSYSWPNFNTMSKYFI